MDKGESTAENIEKLKKMVPKSYQKYIESKFTTNIFFRSQWISQFLE